MFWTVPLSVISSFSMYAQQWYKSYRFADSLRVRSGWNWFGSAAEQQNQTSLSQERGFNEPTIIST